MTQIGKALRDARIAAGIKQNELAQLLGISPAMVNMVEIKGNKFPARLYAKLPGNIRPAVVQAAINELEAQAKQLRPLLTVKPR